MAERELSAFVHAIQELFGSEQAKCSAEDWLHELSKKDDLPSSACEWRLITAKASSRLAVQMSRVLSTESQTFRWEEKCVYLSLELQALSFRQWYVN